MYALYRRARCVVRFNTVEAKIWMRSFTGSFCYDWLAKGRRHPKATGHHTASVVAHDRQTEQLGLLLAMTVGSCHLKNFLSVVKHWKGILWLVLTISDWKLFRVQCQWADHTISEKIVSYKTWTRDFSLDKIVLGQICWAFWTKNQEHVSSPGVGHGKLVACYKDLLCLLWQEWDWWPSLSPMTGVGLMIVR